MFWRVLPYYLSIGMSADDFWNGDPALAKAYRDADELRKQRVNEELWFQGMYIYEALCDASPLFRAFGKKGAKATPYPKQPYDIAPRKEKDEVSERTREKKQMEKMKRSMEAFAASVNANRKKKAGDSFGRERNDNRQLAD